MTPDEIVELARVQFGEETALTVTDESAREFFNAAVMELYEDLPPDRMKPLMTTQSVALTSGKGDVVDTWDKILAVYVDGVPAHAIPRQAIQAHDYSQFFESPVPVFHLDDTHIWVRPTGSTCELVTIDPPSTIDTSTGDDTEYTDFENIWHTALADLITSYMYAQEEDAQQAQLYYNAYSQKLGMLLAPEPSQ